MLLVAEHRSLVLLTRCWIILISTLALCRPDVPWLKLSSIVAASTLYVDLVKVLFETFLALQACNVASCELIFYNPVLGDDRLIGLATVLPIMAL